MALQFGLIDYFIIAIFYSVAATGLFFLWTWLRRWRYWRRVIVPLAVVVLVLPWADEIWIASRFTRLCKEAGLKVYQQANVLGFYNDTGSGTAGLGPITNPQSIDAFEKAGFEFYEARLLNGKVSRSEKVGGRWQRSVLEKPTARYHYKFSDPRQEQPIGYRLKKREVVVVDTESGEIIARETGYKRYSSWISKLWIGFFGSDLVQCPDPGKGPPIEHLPAAALKPSSR